MNNKQKLEMLDLRRQAMDTIRKAPEQFKVCDQCESVLKLSSPVCPICGAYRWLTGEDAVLGATLVAGANWMPRFSGVVPRNL